MSKAQKRMIGALHRENAALRRANRELQKVQGVIIAAGPDATIFISDPVLTAFNMTFEHNRKPEATFEIKPTSMEISHHDGPFSRMVSGSRAIRHQYEIKLVIK
jgi:hypothetical protein